MAKNRYVGDYPVIGIRPIVDGRRGPQMMRESLEPQVWAMAEADYRIISDISVFCHINFLRYFILHFIIPYTTHNINAFYNTKYVIFSTDLRFFLAIRYKASYNLLKQKTAGKLYEIH